MGKKEKIIQFIKFCVVGASNFIVSYVVYAVVIFLGGSWLWGSLLGFVLSVLNAFFWNNRYVFKVEENEERLWWKTLIKTYISYAFSGVLIANALLFLWNNVIGIPELLGPVINLAVTTPINYLMNKFWTFRTNRKK